MAGTSCKNFTREGENTDKTRANKNEKDDERSIADGNVTECLTRNKHELKKENLYFF